MMRMLRDSCHQLEQDLAKVKDCCQAILSKLDTFDNYVTSYAIQRLSRRLLILGYWIIGTAESLYKEHQGLGYVGVLLTYARGITIHWVETNGILADKAWFEACGSKVLSVEEVTGIIVDMLDELSAGNWAKVVDWVKKYGRSPGLAFDEFS
jgi:hypothetical protein